MRDERKNVAPGDAAIGKDELKQVGNVAFKVAGASNCSK